jgi:2,3-dihydroxybiphenyl 1,2-dioxygenase
MMSACWSHVVADLTTTGKGADIVIRSLSYIGFISPAAEEWRTFGPEVLGAEMTHDGPDGAVRLRVDDAMHRITVHPGEADDLAYLGWDTGDSASLDETIARLEQEGIEVDRADENLMRLRAVADVASFTDPFGLRHELTYGLKGGAPFTPGRPMSGFLTGEQGLGHVVLLVPELEAAERFFGEVLGFNVSDSVGSPGVRFFHCPGRASRHHTVALFPAKGRVGMHHLMLEVKSLDDVGTALDVVNEREIPLAMSLGRHTNDLMTSFYVRTPSGFEIEYGTGGRLIDDETWEIVSYEKGSFWGHRAPASGRLRPGLVRPVEVAGGRG